MQTVIMLKDLYGHAAERQRKFAGHVIRKEELEQFIMTGKIQGKKARGRQRRMMLRSMTDDYAIKTNAMFYAA